MPKAITLRHTLRGHTSTINGIAWSPDGKTLASGSYDNTIRLWDVQSGKLLQTLKEHSDWVYSIAYSNDGKTLASGSRDKTIRLWDTQSGKLLQTLIGHLDDVNSIAYSKNGKTLTSGSDDKTIKLWDVQSGKLLQTLKGHSGDVNNIAYSNDGKILASASSDKTIRLWNTQTFQEISILEAHTNYVTSLSFSSDGYLLASKSEDGTVRLWKCDTWETLEIIKEPSGTLTYLSLLAFHPNLPVLATLGEEDRIIRIWDLDLELLLGITPIKETVCYTNAKVVLVGETGVGKSGLALTLTGKPFEATESTHGCHIWTFNTQKEIKVKAGHKENREILLWDLAGQQGYRVFHRLHLNEVAVALVVFDARNEQDPFAGISYWSRAIDEATQGFPIIKFLISARADRGVLPASRERIKKICDKYGFSTFFETSAKEGKNILKLAEAIRSAIQWDKLPSVISTEIFYDMKSFIIDEKEKGQILIPKTELFEKYKKSKSPQNILGMIARFLHIEESEIKDIPEDILTTCLGRLEASNLIKRLSFSDLILLQPEMLDNYCAWVSIAARGEPDGLGFIDEQDVLNGKFAMDKDRTLADKPEIERLMLLATVQELVENNIALREATDDGIKLVFPSELRKDMSEFPSAYISTIHFLFEGTLNAIYATLAVRLINSISFDKENLFKNAALFKGTQKQICGFKMDYPDENDEAKGRLTIFFAKDTKRDMKLLFLRYIDKQLHRLAWENSVEKYLIYQCPECNHIISTELIKKRIELNKPIKNCPACENLIQIDDLTGEIDIQDERVNILDEQSQAEQERQKRLAVLPEKEKNEEYDVYICYDSRDREDVEKLAEMLRNQGILPCYDKDKILVKDYDKFITKIIEKVPAALIISGQNKIWHIQDLEYKVIMETRMREKKLRVMQVLFSGAEPLDKLLNLPNCIDFRQCGLDNIEKYREELQRLVKAILF